MVFTTQHLLDSMERRGFVPANQSTFTSAEILAIATEEIRSSIYPAILTAREEFFVYKKDFTITADVSGYDIPARAYGSLLREVKILRGTELVDLPRMEPEDVVSTSTGQPEFFYLENNQVVLYPTPSSTQDTLRLSYYLTVGDYVELSEAAVVSAIDTATNVVTVVGIPSTWVTGNDFDFIKKDGGHEYRDIDQTSTLVSGSDITFSSLPSKIKVGDYMAIAGNSPLVQCPPELRYSVAQMATAAMLSYAEQPGAEDAYGKGASMLNTAIGAITPRVRGEDQFIQQEWF